MTKTKAKKRGRQRRASNVKNRNGAQPGPLTPTGKGGPPGHDEATKAGNRLLRQEKALDLYVFQRLTMQQIAKQLTAQGFPCTAKTVCLDIHAGVAASQERRDATAEHYRSVEGMRLDQLDRQLVPIAYDQLPPGAVVTVGKGDKAKLVEIPMKGEDRVRLRLQAISMLRQNSESRRKLFGLDMQASMGISEDQIGALLRGLTQDLLALDIIRSNDDLRQLIADAFRKRSGLLLEAAPVAQPEPEASNG